MSFLTVPLFCLASLGHNQPYRFLAYQHIYHIVHNLKVKVLPYERPDRHLKLSMVINVPEFS